MTRTPLPSLERRPVARVVQVGTARIDLDTHTVQRPGVESLRLSPKAAQVLGVLLAHGDRPVHREQLIAQVWPGQFRTDDVVTKAMQELRRALSDAPEPAIETIPRVGYRLMLPIAWLDDDRTASAIPEAVVAAPVASGATPDVALPTHQANPRQPVFTHRPLWFAAGATALALIVSAYRPRADAPSNGEHTPAAASFASASVAPSLSASPLSTDPGDEHDAAISPDGRLIAMTVKAAGAPHSRVYLRDLAGGGNRVLTDIEHGDELAPAWSHDGRMLAYYRIDQGACTLELADALGLSRRVLADCVAGAVVAPEFFPDDSALLVPWLTLEGLSHNGGFARIELATGARSDVEYGSNDRGFELDARFSPDGKRLLVQQGVPPFVSLRLYALAQSAKGAGTALGERFNALNGMTWLSDNRHVIVASDGAGVMELWRLDTVGGALERFGGLSGQFPSASRASDVLVYSHLDRTSGLVSFDAGPAPVFTSTRAESAPAFAPDGGLAFVSDRMGSAQIYLADWSSKAPQRITSLTGGRPFDLSFSSDGRALSFGLRLDVTTSAFILDLDSGAISEPELGMARTVDLRFGAAADQLLYTVWDEQDWPRVYTQQRNDKASARRMTTCTGRAARDGGDGWVYFFSPDRRMLQRVRNDAIDAPCEAVSDRVRWLNRNAYVADPAGVTAILTPLDRVDVAGLYRLTEPPQLLHALPELSRRPLGNIELVGHAGKLIAALPVESNADIWIVRDVGPSNEGR